MNRWCLIARFSPSEAAGLSGRPTGPAALLELVRHRVAHQRRPVPYPIKCPASGLCEIDLVCPVLGIEGTQPLKVWETEQELRDYNELRQTQCVPPPGI